MTTCPYCHQEIDAPPAAIQVRPETVTNVYDAWLVKEYGATHIHVRRHTEKVRIICISSNGTALPKQPLTEAEAEQP